MTGGIDLSLRADVDMRVYTDRQPDTGDPIAAYFSHGSESDIVMLGTGFNSYDEAARFAFNHEDIPDDISEIQLFGLDAVAEKQTTAFVRG